MTLEAGIFCVVCGARPYPELGPPDAREDFDFEGRSQRASGRELSLRRVVLLAAF